MKIAHVTATAHGELDALLSGLAADLQAEGVRLGGVVKVQDNDSPDDHHCHATLQVLPDGPQIRITQDLGPGASACRLDPGALANAVLEVESRLDAPLDLFILNKFGPEESNGRGFCAAIGAALERDVPIIVGVGKPSLEAFRQFAGDLAAPVTPDPRALRDWCRDALAKDSAPS